MDDNEVQVPPLERPADTEPEATPMERPVDRAAHVDGLLTRQAMQQIIRDGGSVMHKGTIIWRAQDLPSELELAGDDEAKRSKALAKLKAQRDRLDQDIKNADADAKAQAKAKAEAEAQAEATRKAELTAQVEQAKANAARASQGGSGAPAA